MFEMTDYVILASGALFGNLAMVTKAKAMQYEMASRLSIMSYFSIVIVLFFDLFLFGTVFNLTEVMGIMIVFIANIFSAYAVYRVYNKKH